MDRTRRHALRAGAALGLGLAGLRRAQACEFFASTLRVTHPWTRATAGDAGSAFVCMKFDEVLEDERLIGVRTPVAARVELVGADGRVLPLDFAIPAGRTTLLAEHGPRLRLVELAMPLELTRTYPLQLEFAKAGALRADLSVDYQRFL